MYLTSTPTIRVRIPLTSTVFSAKFVFEKNENKQKEAGVGPFLKTNTVLINRVSLFVSSSILKKQDSSDLLRWSNPSHETSHKKTELPPLGFVNKAHGKGSGCGSVGRAVAFNTRVPEFDHARDNERVAEPAEKGLLSEQLHVIPFFKTKHIIYQKYARTMNGILPCRDINL